MAKYIPPEFKKEAFNCPHCEAFSHQHWCETYFMVYGKVLARELIHLAHHGVKVYVYRDDKQMKDRTDITWMLQNVPGIQIRAKDDKGFWNIMHDKLFVIPGVIFREGSANWSPSAEGASDYRGNSGHNEQQDNNATYITDPTEIQQAIRQFNHIWNRSSNISY